MKTDDFESNELKTKLRAALMLTRADIKKDYLYDNCVNNYVDGMLREIRSAMALNRSTGSLRSNTFVFAQHAVSIAIGRLLKPQKYIYHIMQAHESTSMLIEVQKGHSKDGSSKLSEMRLNTLYEDLIMKELMNLHMDANVKELEEIEENYNYTVCVDRDSLSSFVEKTKLTIKTNDKGDNYKAQSMRNLAAAQQLLTMVHEANVTCDTTYLRERWEMADCGRIYGHGYSLQRMTKEVRHAALGECHKYDFKACAYAIMASVAHAVNPTLKIASVLDYVKNRAKIRARIAAEVGIGEDVVKTVFTALGFGAKLLNNTHNAIRKELGAAARKQQTEWVDEEIYNYRLGEEEYLRLTSNETFKNIYEEMQLINATVLGFYEDDDFEIDGNAYVPFYKCKVATKKRKVGDLVRRNDAKKLGWLYQALEAMAMKQFAELAQQEPLLTTHDCIYFKRRLNAEQVKDITWQLQQTFAYLRFEYELIRPIATAEYYATKEAKRRSEEQDAIAFEKQQMANWSKEMIALCKKSNDVAADIVDTAAIEATDRFNYIRRQLDETRAQQKVVDTDYEYEYEYDYCTNEVFNH